ncbi:MAG: response regulator [Magnetococcus sp. DMHC-1]|nr:response regulator [Magnetococcales bacterium]
MSDLPRILVVDDQPANLLAMHHLLKGVAAAVVRAASGEEALALCMHTSFALAIIDVHMPGMDGFELAEYMRGTEQTGSIPIIFVTASLAEDIHELRGYALGAVDYIPKPVDDRILLSKVGVFLELYTTREELRRHRDHLAQLVKERTASLERAQADLRALHRHLNEVREEERRHIAQAIHDEMGNLLANQKMTIEWLLKNRLNQELLDTEMPLLLRQVEEAIVRARHLALMLRPPILDECGLLAAMEWQAHTFEQASGITCLVDPASVDITLENGAKMALFRILQESLTNVGKHARANEVHIRLAQVKDWVQLTIRDNGCGIPEPILTNPQRTLGLRGMEERACQNGGELHVETSASGTQITTSLPLHDSRQVRIS